MQYRVLNPDEYWRLPSGAVEGTIPSGAIVTAALDDSGAVVAVWCAMAIVHLEPLWVAPSHRKSPTLLRRLWSAVRSELLSRGITYTMTIILDSIPITSRIATWCGAEKIPGSLYLLDLRKVA